MPTVMGVVNVTPDSFVADVRTPDHEAAIARAFELVDHGAAIVDIGGESTRPGAEPVSIDEETNRVVPVIEALRPQLSDGVRISIDTRHEQVARLAVAAGATIVNDIGASLAAIAGELGVAYVAGHMRGTPDSMQHSPHYDDVVGEVLRHVTAAASTAADSGSPQVWIDPGIGFGKTIEHNLALIANLDRLVESRFDVLIGVSRKSLIGALHAASDTKNPIDAAQMVATDDRLEGSLAIAAWGVAMGVDVIRTHDVSATIQAVKVVVAGTSV